MSSCQSLEPRNHEWWERGGLLGEYFVLLQAAHFLKLVEAVYVLCINKILCYSIPVPASSLCIVSISKLFDVQNQSRNSAHRKCFSVSL